MIYLIILCVTMLILCTAAALMCGAEALLNWWYRRKTLPPPVAQVGRDYIAGQHYAPTDYAKYKATRNLKLSERR